MDLFFSDACAFRPGELMLLLDDHCARANKKERGGGATLAAYDFLYLRMDFSR